MLKKFYSAVFISIFFLIVTGLASLSAAADAQRITKDGLRAMLDNPDLLIIDVRTEKEWKKASQKIKGAIWEDADEVKKWADKYPKDKAIALYCSWPDERTSAWTAHMLLKVKFSSVYVLIGGWYEWLNAGYPVEPK